MLTKCSGCGHKFNALKKSERFCCRSCKRDYYEYFTSEPIDMIQSMQRNIKKEKPAPEKKRRDPDVQSNLF